LILGVAAGEGASTKAFGLMKKPWLHIVEIVLFVISIIVIFSSFAITELNSTWIILFYFTTGLITIIVIRAGMTGFGIVSEHVKEKILKIKKEEDYIIGLKKALERRGFENDEIKKISKEVGLNSKKTEKIFDFIDK